MRTLKITVSRTDDDDVVERIPCYSESQGDEDSQMALAVGYALKALGFSNAEMNDSEFGRWTKGKTTVSLTEAAPSKPAVSVLTRKPRGFFR